MANGYVEPIDYADAGYFDGTTIKALAHTLAPGAIVTLYELDATAQGGAISRFHAGTNGLRQAVVWQGNTYNPFPIEVTGFEFSGKGQIPRPVVRVANVNGLMGALVRDYQDLIGAKLTRKRTMVRFLDAVNFPDRRNLLTYSEQFDNAAWYKNSSGSATAPSVTENAGVAPDGNVSADRIVFNAGSNGASDNSHLQGPTFTATAQPYTFSVYLRTFGATAQKVHMSISGAAASILTVTDVWQRFSVTWTASSGNWNVRLLVGLGLTGASADLLVWGAQLEAGTTPTDYQPIGATWSRNPTADPTAAFPDDVFYIDRKSGENKVALEFELSASFDVAGVQLPRRYIVQNVCPFKYRGTECAYTGTSYFDANDNPVGSAGLDVCGKRLSSCQARFGTNKPLSFGGFPAAGLTR